MKAKILLLLGTCLCCFFTLEVGLRVLASRLDLDESPPTSPFIEESSFGYEPKAHAMLSFRDENGGRFFESMNSEGFRGPEYRPVKPENTFRIMTLGDSVVEAMTVRDSYAWTQSLQRRLQGRSVKTPHVEVMNGGVGGYTAWQTVERLRRHGLAYHPDLLIVMVGWNDFLYSALPIWKAKLELSQIQKYYAPVEAEHVKGDTWSRVKRGLSGASYVARAFSHWRDHRHLVPWENRVIAEHQCDSGLPFNDAALKQYNDALEKMHADTQAAGIPLVLMTWPTLLRSDLLEDPVIHRRILQTYAHFRISTKELWIGYLRYQDVQRAFAKRHPDILLIDAAATWQPLSREDRLRDFVDMAHLSIAGNDRLADTVAAQVKLP